MSRLSPPRRKLQPSAAQALVAQADAHGVLPAVLRHFPPFSGDPDYMAAKAEAEALSRSARAFALMLRSESDALTSIAVGLPMTVVKGPVFARAIYPEPKLRTFTDIDILAAPAAIPGLAAILVERGYDVVDKDAGIERKEWKWVHRENKLLMIEVHTDLVHAPSLRRCVSLCYEDIAGEARTPAGCLLVALVHGAYSHCFERLQQVVDVCQAARALTTTADEQRFATLIDRTGFRLAAVLGLDLAGRLLAEPRCQAIARELGWDRRVGVARLLMTGTVVTSTKTSRRVLHAWRRQAFRELLKRASHSDHQQWLEEPR